MVGPSIIIIFNFVIWQCKIDGIVIDSTIGNKFTVSLNISVIFGMFRTAMLYCGGISIYITTLVQRKKRQYNESDKS